MSKKKEKDKLTKAGYTGGTPLDRVHRLSLCRSGLADCVRNGAVLMGFCAWMTSPHKNVAASRGYIKNSEITVHVDNVDLLP